MISRKKLKKSYESVEAITITEEALQEYIYEKLNDTRETEDEEKIRYLIKSKTRITKELTDKPVKFKKLDGNRCGSPNWS